VFSVI